MVARDRRARPARFSRQQRRHAGHPGADPVFRSRPADRGFLAGDPEDEPDRPVPLHARRGRRAAAARGAICSTASIAGVQGSGSSIPYATSKAGVINLTRSLARTLAPEIRVNAVAPGFVDSPWNKDWPADRKVAVDRAHAAEARLQARGHRRDDLLPVRRGGDGHGADDHRRWRADAVAEFHRSPLGIGGAARRGRGRPAEPTVFPMPARHARARPRRARWRRQRRPVLC